jgi:hypothetical protein
MRRLTVALTVGLLLGWATGPVRVVVERETVVVVAPVPENSWRDALLWETPIADALVDWDEVDRQTDCLWELLQSADVEITLEVVLAFGTWADAQGGPCLLTEREDDE